MLLSEIGDKEIVDLRNGSRHGQLWDAEMLFEKDSGKINSILVPNIQTKIGFLSNHDYMHLPWNSIVKIGEDIIIFESSI
jgi:YlmC/YmxH family sporulation protein